MLGKQAKTLSAAQINAVAAYLLRRRNGLRNQTAFLLSVKAGLRAKEIACLRWSMVVDAEGNIGSSICLSDAASKGKSGRIIPIAKELGASLSELYRQQSEFPNFDVAAAYVIRTERRTQTSPQVIVNMFRRWFADLELIGCSSHSGRRTFITNAARKIALVGGSLRDVQCLAGHSSLQVTQRYIEADSSAQQRVVNLL